MLSEKLKEMTLAEKVALVAGNDFMYTNPIPRLGIPALSMADGPHGLRKQRSSDALNGEGSEPATAFPTAATTANSWDENLLTSMGEAMAGECKNYGVGIILGPGTNIKRNPLCGRNFEYFSEDPLLAGKLSAAMIRGVDSCGVGVSLKHYSMNNSELYRFMGDSLVDSRAMREIYLKPFEIAVKESNTATVMCAYNKVNGTYCSENKLLLNDILRDDWGFGGAVMSDWGAVHDRVKGIFAGLDLEMPGDTDICRARLFDAVTSGELDEAVLDRAVLRILDLVEKYGNLEKVPADFEANDKLSAVIAEQSCVLMKNDGALPIKEGERIAVVGALFEKMRYQGAGSSLINSTKVTSPKDSFDETGVNYKYFKGYNERHSGIDSELINEALLGVEDFDKVLVFAGLTDFDESEAVDRSSMSLDESQLDLINALCKTGKEVVVILFGGSVVELPFADEVNAILNMFLPGQRGGEACRRVLFGEANPSGRLAETWPISYKDVIFGTDYSTALCEPYKESVFVGYRYYSTSRFKVRYPFGHGLSYTSFEYSDISVEDLGDKINITLNVTNTGEVAGKDTVMIYSSKNDSKIYRPSIELRAFTKVDLEAKETKNVNITLQKSALSYYNPQKCDWCIEDGEYEISIRKNAEDEIFSKKIFAKGEVGSPYSEEVVLAYRSPSEAALTDAVFEKMSGLKIERERSVLPITPESPFTDLKETFFGRILYNAVMSIPRSKMKIVDKMPDGPERDNAKKSVEFLERIFMSNSIISMSMSSGKMFPYNLALGFADIANGRLIRGIYRICKKTKAPKLPKDIK